jgi:hypothetical protein
MTLAFDKEGKPFIEFRDQKRKKWTRGLEALRANIMAEIAAIDNNHRNDVIASPPNETTIPNDDGRTLK